MYKRQRKERAGMTHTIDLKEYEDKMNDSTWLVMDAVGKEGYSRYSDIETYVMERESTLTKTKIRVASEKMCIRDSLCSPGVRG